MLESFIENIADLPKCTYDMLRDMNLHCTSNIYAEKGTYMGYSYSSDQFLFLKYDDYGAYFYVMKIKLIIYDKETRQITFLGNEVPVCNVHEKGLMEIQDSEGNLVHKNIDDFVDRAPIDSLRDNNKTYLFVKHSIPLVQ